MKSSLELKEMYGKKYVDNYENHSPIRLERLVSYFSLNNTHVAVDFACGNGMLMEYVAPQVKEYIGVDFSEFFIDSANNRKNRLGIANAKFVHSEIENFCQTHKKIFDVGFAMDFSGHVYDKEWVKILNNIRASLKVNGKLYLHTVNANFFLEIMKKRTFIVKEFPEKVAIRTPEHNISLLEEAGFRVNKLRLLPHYNTLRFIHPLSYIPLIGKYFKARIFIEATVW